QPASPNPLNFGEVRFDQTRTMAIEVINTGGSTIGITGITIMPGANYIAGELAVVNCTHDSVVVPCPTMANPYQSSGIGDKLVLNVRCDPQDRVGMIDAVLTVHSDLNTAMPDRRVPLRCISTTAELQLTPSNMVLDFGPTDLDANPVSVTRRITLMNAGQAPLDVGAGVAAGAHLARFQISATPATVVMPGSKFDID